MSELGDSCMEISENNHKHPPKQCGCLRLVMLIVYHGLPLAKLRYAHLADVKAAIDQNSD